jgi:hypothetical protein
MSASGEANGRARVDGCTGPGPHARGLSGAGSWVLPRSSKPARSNDERATKQLAGVEPPPATPFTRGSE